MPADDQEMHVALRVGDGDHRVVERRAHMRDARGDVLAFATTNACCFLGHDSLYDPYVRSRHRRKTGSSTGIPA
jgi:hypothetical protein